MPPARLMATVTPVGPGWTGIPFSFDVALINPSEAPVLGDKG